MTFVWINHVIEANQKATTTIGKIRPADIYLEKKRVEELSIRSDVQASLGVVSAYGAAPSN